MNKKNIMQKLFVPYELALKLKEKGFEEECFARYNGGEFQLTKHQNWNLYPNVYRLDIPNTKVGLIKSGTPVIISAPLYQQVVDWFREKFNTHIEIRVIKNWDADRWNCYVLKIIPNVIKDAGFKEEYDSVYDHTVKKMSYYDALNKAIEEAIKLI